MKITTSTDVLKANKIDLNKAKKLIRASYKGCKNNNNLVVNIYNYESGKFKNFSYQSNLTVFETWPCGSAGIVWLAEVPEKDYI